MNILKNNKKKASIEHHLKLSDYHRGLIWEKYLNMT